VKRWLEADGSSAYLACTELAEGTFWTADDALFRTLGNRRPHYVRHIRDLASGAGAGS